MKKKIWNGIFNNEKYIFLFVKLGVKSNYQELSGLKEKTKVNINLF